jgi:hypothetical protein
MCTLCHKKCFVGQLILLILNIRSVVGAKARFPPPIAGVQGTGVARAAVPSASAACRFS